MSKKTIKYIIEMIFIFIIPLLFMVFCFSFKTENEYDSNNNLVSSEKVLDIKDVNLLREYSNNLQYKYIINDFNLWNEEYQLGYWASGYFQPSEDGFLSSVDYIRVQPSLNYFYYNGKYVNTSSVFYIVYFDQDYTYIRRDTITYNNNNIITTPSDCYYIQFSTQSNYGIEYLHDICINYSISWANGNYVPYGDDLIIYSNEELNGYSLKEINYTWYMRFFNSIFDSLELEYSLILQIVVTYFILWFIMFVLWHILYVPFDKLFHLRKD